MEMFEYFVNGVQKNRWDDINDISEKARLLLEQIKIMVPTGTTPSIGFPKWNVGLLYNLMSDIVNDVNALLDVINELADKALFKIVFTCDGHYGYYEDVKNLARDVFRKEGLTDSSMKKNISIFLLLPEDTTYIKKTS